MNLDNFFWDLNNKSEEEFYPDKCELSNLLSEYSGSGNRDLKEPEVLKKKLIKDYRDSKIKDVLKCSVTENRFGEVYHKEEKIDDGLNYPNCDKEEFLKDLKLVPGVGPSREKKLKENNYESIRDLKKHEKWKDKTKEILHNFKQNKLRKNFNKIIKEKSCSDPETLKFSGLYKEKDFAILDIETMGLTDKPVVLIGLGLPKDQTIDFHQFILKDFDQELAVLELFYDKIKEKKAVITFNGKRFDIPYLEKRFNYHGQNKLLKQVHFDLYYFSRRNWNNKLNNHKLNTIERKIIGIEREIDIPSSMVPEFYKAYREEKNPGPLIPILYHNRQDILTLTKLIEELQKEMLK